MYSLTDSHKRKMIQGHHQCEVAFYELTSHENFMLCHMEGVSTINKKEKGHGRLYVAAERGFHKLLS